MTYRIRCVSRDLAAANHGVVFVTWQPPTTVWFFGFWGITGCMADANGKVISCNQPNRPVVQFAAFDADVALVFTGADAHVCQRVKKMPS